ncbi:hypothetical protein [Limoniibacter endophyticus]|nr:hypothetical protein [Limoniibacter endophyticus]
MLSFKEHVYSVTGKFLVITCHGEALHMNRGRYWRLIGTAPY